jgi:hypothetical protein
MLCLSSNCDVVLYEMHMSSVDSLFEHCDVIDNFLICGDCNLSDINWYMDLSLPTILSLLLKSQAMPGKSNEPYLKIPFYRKMEST